MLKFISSFVVLFLVSTLFAPLTLLAATKDVVQLEVTVPSTTRVGEAIDITVRAVDKDKKTVTTYNGSVIFNTDNPGDTVPASGKSVAFTADDSGEKKFSKGLVFKKTGKQKIYVTDLSDDILGEATITVDPALTTPPVSDQTITIITPENGTKVTSDTVLVSGKTRKNSKVAISINGKTLESIASDDTGIFTKNITGLTQETNILKAELLDASSASIATSPEVRFGLATSNSAIYGVTITPSSTVEASSPIGITVDATPGLSLLNITLDGTLLTTKESTAGKYSINTVAPQKPGVYKLLLSYKDTLGQTKSSDSPTSLTVIEKAAPPPLPEILPPAFKNIKTTTVGHKVVFDFLVENPPADLQSFKIGYGKNADSLSQEVITLGLDLIPSTITPGGYTWFVDNLPSDTYTFKIFGRTKDGALISGLVSEPIVATIGKDSCTIGNIAGLKVDTDKTKSVISWQAPAGAVSYNIYKVSAAGDYVLFQNTKEPTYTLFLSKGAITYENFAVKALCDSTTESKEYSSMSRVQTGPGMIALLVIISAGLGIFITRRLYI